MSGRPESNDRGGYGDATKHYDQDAWQEFTPYRPGDPPVHDEAPTMWSTGTAAEGRRAPAGQAGPVERGDGRGQPDAADDGEQRRNGRWWTEDVPRRYSGGERVRSTKPVGGPFVSHVPAGTEGRVVERRETLLSGDRLTVQFNNGYVEKDVKPEDVKRETWW